MSCEGELASSVWQLASQVVRGVASVEVVGVSGASLEDSRWILTPVATDRTVAMRGSPRLVT